VSARVKLSLLIGAFVCANVAVWGAKTLITALFDPILRALGA